MASSIEACQNPHPPPLPDRRPRQHGHPQSTLELAKLAGRVCHALLGIPRKREARSCARCRSHGQCHGHTHTCQAPGNTGRLCEPDVRHWPSIDLPNAWLRTNGNQAYTSRPILLSSKANQICNACCFSKTAHLTPRARMHGYSYQQLFITVLFHTFCDMRYS